MALSKRKQRTTGTTGRDGRGSSNTSGRSTRSTATSSGPMGQGFGSTVSAVPNTNPLWTDPYANETRGNGLAIDRLMQALQNGGSPLQSLLSMTDNRNWDNEFWSMFFQFALQQAQNQDQRSYDQSITQEQRQYDWNLLQDQRTYNNPQNELARLMGAGISRDAALQLMSGSAGNIGSAGGSSPVTNTPTAVGSTSGTPGDQKLAIANTAISGIQMVANLCQQGVDMYSAIQSAQMLQAQNYMTQQQVGAYQYVNQVTQTLQDGVTQGILTPADFDGWSNANDVYKWLIDHADTDLVKPLKNSGAIAGVFGSTLGRQMFNQHWSQMREGRDAGKLFDNYVRQQELQSDLMSIQDANARRAYYTDFVGSLQELIINNEEIGILWNEYQNGQKIVSINGEILKQQQYATNAARRQDFTDQVYFESFENALGSDAQMPDGTTVNGRQMINYHTFSGLMQTYMNDLVFTGKGQTHKWTDAEGHEIYGNSRQRYLDYLNAHADAAITAAFVQELVEGNHLNGLQGNFAPIYKFFDMWNSSGANQFVQTTAAGGAALIRAFK